eukprot:7856415-Karenia_brevis.AAC.1
MLKSNHPCPMPAFSAQCDGDLWEVAYKLIRDRGPYSIRVTKVKGHATVAATQHSTHLTRLMHGNNRADTTAKHAMQNVHGPNVVQLSSLYHKKKCEYSDFLAHIHDIIVRMYMAIHKLRHSDAHKLTQPGDTKNVLTTLPLCAPMDGAKALDFKANAHFFAAHMRKAEPAVKGLLTLLTHCCVAPVPNGTPGHTWLELYLLSLAASPDPLARALNKTALQSTCIGVTLRRFKKQ